MISLIKDAISFLVYLLACSFFKNKNAILVYHAIDHMDNDSGPYKMNVDPGLFEKQMAYMAQRKGRFIITFDDGFESVYTNAIAVIRKYGIKAILFLTTDYIDGKIDFDGFFGSKYSPKPLTRQQIKEINAAGVEVGSHSLSHKNMANLDEKSLYLESSVSRKRIEDMAGCAVSSFAYPFGNAKSFNEKTKKAIQDAGYKKAYTNIMGVDNSKDEPFAINRIRIYGTDNMFRFKMKIAGAYNWVDALLARFNSWPISDSSGDAL